MSAAPLRLVDDEGVDHRTARLERDLASAKRMLQVAYEEMKVKDDTIKKYHRENTSLKGRLLKQQHQDAQDELVNAVFEFWKLMTVHPRAKLGADRVKAVNARVREGATPRDFFKAIVGAAYDSFVDDKGKTHDDLELICRGSKKFEDRIETFYLVPDVRKMVEECAAIDAARALMDLDRRPKAETE
jgi:hypothetical protein